MVRLTVLSRLIPNFQELRRVTSIDTTPRVGSPDISQILNPQASPLLNVEAPAFSPIALPKPGRQVDEIWSSREVRDFLYSSRSDSYLFR